MRYTYCQTLCLLAILLCNTLGVYGNPTKVLREIWVEMNEKLTINLDKYYDGTSLTYEIDAKTPINWLSIEKKLTALGQTDFADTKGWSALYMDQNPDGTWGKNVAFLDTNNFMNYGTLAGADKTPIFHLRAPLDESKGNKLRCFDIARADTDTLLVDCLVFNEAGDDYDNLFYMIDTTDPAKPSIITIKNTDPFKLGTSFTRRIVYVKIDLFTYFIRWTPTKIGTHASNYIEIFRYNCPGSISKLATLDEKTFGVAVLNVKDVRIFGSDAFVLCSKNGVFRFNFLPDDGNYKMSRYILQDGTALVVDPQEEFGVSHLYVIIATTAEMHEVDWINPIAPKLKTLYETGSIVSMGYNLLTVSREFIAANLAGLSQFYIYRRGETRLMKDIHVHLNFEDKDATTGLLNPVTNNLLMISPKSVVNHQVSRANLRIVSPDVHDLFKPILNIYQEGKLIGQNYLTIHVMHLGCVNTHFAHKFPIVSYQNYPGSGRTYFDDFIVGADMIYKPVNYPNGSVVEINKAVAVHAPFAPVLTDSIYVRFQSASGAGVPFYWLFAQQQDFSLKYSFCLENDGTAGNLTCLNVATYNLPAKITRMEIGERFLTITTADKPGNVEVFDIHTMKSLGMIKYEDVRDYCNDLDIVDTDSYSFLFCTKAGRDSIEMFDLTSKDMTTPVHVLNRDTLNIQGYFKPQDVIIGGKYNDILWVRDYEIIRVIKVGLQGIRFATLVNSYPLDTLKTDPSKIRYSILADSLIIVSEVKQLVQEYEIINGVSIRHRRDYNLVGHTISTAGMFVSASRGSNLFYIYASNKTETGEIKGSILVYKVGASGNLGIYHIIPLDEESRTTVFLHATNWKSEYDLFLRVTPFGQSFTRMYPKTFMTYRLPISDPNAQADDVSYSVNVSNRFNPDPKFIYTEFYVWNAKNVLASGNAASISDLSTNYTTPSGVRVLPFNVENTVSGAVEGLRIVGGCSGKECSDGRVRIRQKADVIHRPNRIPIGQTALNDIVHNNGKLFVQTERKTYVLNAENTTQILDVIQIVPESDVTAHCQNVRVNEKGQMAAVICFDTENKKGHLFLVSLITVKPTVVGHLAAHINTVVDAKLTDDFLFIFERTSENDGAVRIFQIVTDPALALVEFYRLGNLNFGLETFPALGFDILCLAPETPDAAFADHLIAVIDPHFGIRAVRLSSLPSAVTGFKLVYTSISLATQFHTIEVVPIDQIEYNAIAFVEGNKTNDKISALFVVSAKNYHAHLLKLVLDLKTNNFDLITHYRFERYADILHFPVVKASKNRVILYATRNETHARRDSVLVYEINENLNDTHVFSTQIVTAARVHQTLTLGKDALPFEYGQLKTSVDGSDRLWTFDDPNNNVVEFGVYDRFAVLLNDTSVSTTGFTLQIYNDFSTVDISVTLSSSGSALTIVLISCGLLIIVTLAVYIMTRKPNVKKSKFGAEDSKLSGLLVNYKD